MKKLFVAIAACAMFASCCTIPTPIAATSNVIGSKCGTTTSVKILNIFGVNGNRSGIQQAAKWADITKISHVDMYDKAIFFGLVKKRTIKVYGE